MKILHLILYTVSAFNFLFSIKFFVEKNISWAIYAILTAIFLLVAASFTAWFALVNKKLDLDKAKFIYEIGGIDKYNEALKDSQLS